MTHDRNNDVYMRVQKMSVPYMIFYCTNVCLVFTSSYMVGLTLKIDNDQGQ